MMAEDENNFYRLIGFLVSLCPEIFREYFKTKVLCGDTFEAYLNKLKHIICHLARLGQCCECLSKESQGTDKGKPGTDKDKPSDEKRLTQEQLKLLFKFTGNTSCQHDKVIKESKVKTKHFCICKYSAWETISMETVLDVTMTHCILKNCEPKDNSRDNWIIQIKNVRNEVAHLTDTKSTSDTNFKSLWCTLEGCTGGLASQISPKYEKYVSDEICKLKRMQITYTEKIKEKELMFRWWREKLLDFEKFDQQYFNETSTKLDTCHSKLSKVLKNIKNLESKVDKIYISIEGNETAHKLLSEASKDDNSSQNTAKKTIPVIMYLETPETWDTAQVIEGVLKIQQSLNLCEGPLKIKAFSTEELTLFIDVASRLLGQSSEFQKEVKQLLTNIVKESRVDTTVTAEMNATISISEEEVIPRIDIGGQNMYKVEYGTQITIECDIYSGPCVTEVYWQKENSSGKVTRIQADSVGYEGSSSLVPSLTILDPTKTDAGEYTCFVTNIVNTASSESIILTVTGDLPDIKTTGSCDVEYGQDTSLECTINSRPVLTDVYWEIRSGVEGEITYENQSCKYKDRSSATVSLEVKSATMAGRYTCYATNNVGTRSSDRILLTVTTDGLIVTKCLKSALRLMILIQTNHYLRKDLVDYEIGNGVQARLPGFKAIVSGRIAPIDENQADVHFLLDASWSVGSDGFEKQKQFVGDFAKTFSIGHLHFQIGLSSFAYEVHPEFFINKHQNTGNLLAAVGTVKYNGGGTYTDKALEWAVKNAFAKDAGQREGVKKFIILLTDGESSSPKLTMDQVRILHQKKINVLVVGVADRVYDEWGYIASKPEYVFHTSNFHTLSGILSSVTNGIRKEISDSRAVKRSMLDFAESSNGKKLKVS